MPTRGSPPTSSSRPRWCASSSAPRSSARHPSDRGRRTARRSPGSGEPGAPASKKRGCPGAGPRGRLRLLDGDLDLARLGRRVDLRQLELEEAVVHLRLGLSAHDLLGKVQSAVEAVVEPLPVQVLGVVRLLRLLELTPDLHRRSPNLELEVLLGNPRDLRQDPVAGPRVDDVHPRRPGVRHLPPEQPGRSASEGVQEVVVQVVEGAVDLAPQVARWSVHDLRRHRPTSYNNTMPDILYKDY